jgi:signal transduction histidine kinase
MVVARDAQPTASATRGGHIRIRTTGRTLVAWLGWGAALAAALAPAALLLGPPLIGATPPPPSLALGISIVHLPVVGAIAILAARRVRPAPPTDVLVWDERAASAEAALAREQERMHELRSTIGGITAARSLLRDTRVPLAPQERARLERLHDVELARLQRVLTDRGTDPEAVSLEGIVDPLVESLRVQGHDVRWNGTGERVWGRPDDVAEAIHVVLHNAARHAGGRGVEITVRRVRDVVDIRVKDDGPGVRPDVLPVLFRRGGRRADSPGDGLGLHIANRLAREMGGRLRLEPRPAGAHGATFVITLPTSAGVDPCLGLSG